MKQIDQTIYELLETPMRADSLAKLLPDVPRRAVAASLQRLTEEGKILRNKKNKYGWPQAFGCIIGTFLPTERSFAFVRPEDNSPDIFIPPRQSGDAWQGDRVLVQLAEQPRKGARSASERREGAVIKILERSRKDIIGVVQKRGKSLYLVPDNTKLPRIDILRSHAQGAQGGDKAALKVVFWGDRKKQLGPQGAITRILGQGNSMEASIAAILHENGIPSHFPAEVTQQADAISQKIDPDTIPGRTDLRADMLFTIDGDDAKDFDDAVSLEPLENGARLLGVHIADVSHYVTPGSPLDLEAYHRGTSVYYPGHVVPMLPFSLSNGICSLRPDEDRLAFSAFMQVEKDGRVSKSWFSKSVIRSKARLTYCNVNKILAGDGELRAQYSALVPTLEALNDLAHTLRRRRMARGALDLDIPEAHIIVDEAGRAVAVSARERGDAERLIEECMLLANESVAAFMQKNSFPTVYRVHEKPDPEKLRVFAALARPFGYRVNPSKPEDTAQLQTVLDGAKGKPEQQVLPAMLLRSLARARYQDECIGHYGLKAKFYLHFTSPIRRYPDLVAHRMLQKLLDGESPLPADFTFCEDAGKQSTTREQNADTAERDIDKLYIADYMTQFIGEEFEGVVTGVTGFGLFVALPNLVEGLIRMESLEGDYYEFDGEKMTLMGKRTGKRFAIGTGIRVKLIAASNTTGQIDFIPA